MMKSIKFVAGPQCFLCKRLEKVRTLAFLCSKVSPKLQQECIQVISTNGPWTSIFTRRSDLSKLQSPRTPSASLTNRISLKIDCSSLRALQRSDEERGLRTIIEVSTIFEQSSSRCNTNLSFTTLATKALYGLNYMQVSEILKLSVYIPLHLCTAEVDASNISLYGELNSKFYFEVLRRTSSTCTRLCADTQRNVGVDRYEKVAAAVKF